MNINALLGVSVSVCLSQSVGQGNWPSGMLHSGRARSALQRSIGSAVAAGSSSPELHDTSTKPYGRSSSPGLITRVNDPVLIAAARERVNRRNSVLKSASDLESAGHWSAALGILRSLASTQPDETLADHIADVEFRLGNATGAYRSLVPFVANTTSNGTLLRASLAASEVGEVYRGQKAFCLGAVASEMKNHKEFAESVPTGDSPREVALMSVIALGFDCNNHGDSLNAVMYLEKARQMGARHNAYVDLVLARIYGCERDFTEAFRLLDDATKHLKPGRTLDQVIAEKRYEMAMREQVRNARRTRVSP